MSDLISLEELRKEIKLQKSYGGQIQQRDYGTGFVVSLSILEGKLADFPTVDAKPVRHGRWIHCKGKSNLWYCSECGGKIIYNPTRKTYMPSKGPIHEINKWCRNCGAKMDGGNDE